MIEMTMVDDTSHCSSKSVVRENEVSNHSDNNVPTPHCEIRRDCSIIRAGGNVCDQMVNSSLDRPHLETKHLYCEAQDEEVSKLHSPLNDDTLAELAVQHLSDAADAASGRENGTDGPLYKYQVRDVQASERSPMQQFSSHQKGPAFKDQVRNILPEAPVFIPRVGNVSSHEACREDESANLSSSQPNHAVDYVRTDARGLVSVSDISNSAATGEDVVAHVVTEAAVSAIAVVVEDDERGTMAIKKRWMCFAFAGLALLVCTVLVAAFSREITNRSKDVPDTSPEPTMNLNNEPISGCEDALPLFLGEIVNASTVNETIVSVSPCGKALPSNSSGVWFKYVPAENSTWVRITTCTDDESLNGDFDSQMIVYRGACYNLQCIDGNDNELYSTSGCGSESGVTFRPDLYPADVYYVLVNGHEDQSSGSFGVQVKALLGETCENAILLQNFQMLSGSSVNATMQTVSGCKDKQGLTAPGVWYVYQSTLLGLSKFSFCTDDASLQDYRFGIFSGESCSNLELNCEDEVVVTGPCQEVAVFSAPYRVFYVMVSALTKNTTVDFTIQVFEKEFMLKTPRPSPGSSGYPGPPSIVSSLFISIVLIALIHVFNC